MRKFAALLLGSTILLSGCTSTKEIPATSRSEKSSSKASVSEEVMARTKADLTERYKAYYDYVEKAQNEQLYKAAATANMNGDSDDELILVTKPNEKTLKVEISQYDGKGKVTVVDTFEAESYANEADSNSYQEVAFSIAYNDNHTAVLCYEVNHMSTWGYYLEHYYYTLENNQFKLLAKEEVVSSEDLSQEDKTYFINEVEVSLAEYEALMGSYTHKICLYSDVADVDYTKGARVLKREAGLLSESDKVDFMSYIAEGKMDTINVQIGQSQDEMLRQNGQEGFSNYPTGNGYEGSYQGEDWSVRVQGYYPMIEGIEGRTGFQAYNIIVGESIDTIIEELGEHYYLPTESELEAWKEEQGIRADFQAIQYQSGEYALTIGYVDGVSCGIYLENGRKFSNHLLG